MLAVLIILNIFIYISFIFGVMMSPFIADCIDSLAVYKGSSFYTLLSYAFLHEGFEHLFLNCASLFMFARLLNKISLKEWLIVYFLGAIFSALIFIAFEPGAKLMGASAAISALIGYAAMKLRQPSLIGIILLLNLISIYLGPANIAFSSHISGLIWGIISYFILSRLRF